MQQVTWKAILGIRDVTNRSRCLLLASILGGMLANWGPLLAGAAEAEQRFQFTQTHMGMAWNLIFYADNQKSANSAAEAAFARIAALDQILSDFKEDSELTRLTATAGTQRDVLLGADLFRVLTASQTLAQQSEGAFDVTIGPLTRLWRRARRQREMPSAARLAEALAATNYQALQIDAPRRTARLVQPGMRLDLGGIAAGYAADEALVILKQHGINRALIDASGDVVVSEPPPGQDGWVIAVEIPVAHQQSERQYVSLRQAALATSGDLYQFVEFQGVRYSHIVDPYTGKGLTNRITATVVAPTGMAADSLATLVCVRGYEASQPILAQSGANASVSWIEGETWRRAVSPSWPGRLGKK